MRGEDHFKPVVVLHHFPEQVHVRLIRTSGRRRLSLNRSKMASVLITCRLKSNFSLPSCSVSLQTQRAESHPTTVYRDTQRDIALHQSSRFPRCSPARRIGPIPLQHHADSSYRGGGTPRIKPCDIWTLNKLRLILQVSWIGDELVSTAWSLTLKRGCCCMTGNIKVVRRSLSLLLLLLIHPKF